MAASDPHMNSFAFRSIRPYGPVSSPVARTSKRTSKIDATLIKNICDRRNHRPHTFLGQRTVRIEECNGSQNEARIPPARRGGRAASSVRGEGLQAPLSLGAAEPHPAREAQAVRIEDVFPGCDFFKFKAARIDSPDLAALPADGAFVGQIGLTVVGDLDRPQRKAFGAVRFRRQLPRQEDVFVFEHQIPMLAIVCSVM